MKKHIQISIFGKVQGVFFRASAKAVADQLKIKGFVVNKKDGSVYIEAEGTENSLMQFEAWCQHGPDDAQVENIEKRENEMVGFTDFVIRKKA